MAHLGFCQVLFFLFGLAYAVQFEVADVESQAQTDVESETQTPVIPVYVMLSLTQVNNDGSVNDLNALNNNLVSLKNAGAAGVMLDVWWGLVEKTPKQYNWNAYKTILQAVKDKGLRAQVIMSFHKCGGNVGDACNIPLPSWLGTNFGYQDKSGTINPEYISLFYDNTTIGNTGRTPLLMYEDYMTSFATNFKDFLSGGSAAVISTVEVGLGPCGEMRYPAYPLAKWSFPGVGEFQVYDPLAKASLTAAAKAFGQPAWNLPPGDAGSYGSLPDATNFFKQDLGFNGAYGKFFLSWYSGSLIQHGRDVLARAKKAFSSIPGVHLDGKVAGIHWQYAHNSHAAELTAGYYNLPNKGIDGYAPIARMFKEFDAGFCFTCLEMRNSEQTVGLSRPEELVAQTKQAAINVNIAYAGENALERYDRTAYDTMFSKATMIKNIASLTYLRISNKLMTGANFEEFKRFVRNMNAGRLSLVEVNSAGVLMRRG